MELTMALCWDWALAPGAGGAWWFPLTRLSASEEGTENTGHLAGRGQDQHKPIPTTVKSQSISNHGNREKHEGFVMEKNRLALPDHGERVPP